MISISLLPATIAVSLSVDGQVRELGEDNDGKWHELSWLEHYLAYPRDWVSWTKVFHPTLIFSLDFFAYISWLSNSLIVMIWSRTVTSIVVVGFSH